MRRERCPNILMRVFVAIVSVSYFEPVQIEIDPRFRTVINFFHGIAESAIDDLGCCCLRALRWNGQSNKGKNGTDENEED